MGLTLKQKKFSRRWLIICISNENFRENPNRRDRMAGLKASSFVMRLRRDKSARQERFNGKMYRTPPMKPDVSTVNFDFSCFYFFILRTLSDALL
jgi:hypothetical protein